MRMAASFVHAAIPARTEASVCAVYPDTPIRTQLKADVAGDLKDSFAVFSGTVIATNLFTVWFRVEQRGRARSDARLNSPLAVAEPRMG